MTHVQAAISTSSKGQKQMLLAGGAALCAIALIVLCGGAELLALKAAGALGQGSPIEGLGTFIDTIKGKVLWLAGTVGAASVAVIALLFFVGHTRAQDIAFKTAVGFAILAGSTGIIS